MQASSEAWHPGSIARAIILLDGPGLLLTEWMKMLEYEVIAVAAVVLLIASYTDIKRGTISNRLTYPAALIGVLMNGAVGAFGGLVFFGFGYLMWQLGQVGRGDVGLFATMGALLPNVGAPTFPFLCFPLVVICCGGASGIQSFIEKKKRPAAPFMFAGLLALLLLI